MDRVAEEERVSPIVEVWLIGWTSPVDVVEIERRTAEVHQCIRIVLLLQTARRIERQIVINELAEVGIKSGYAALLVVLAVLRVGGVGIGRHYRAELGQVGNVVCFRSTEGGRRQRSEESSEFAVEQGRTGGRHQSPRWVGVLGAHQISPPWRLATDLEYRS